MSKQDGQKPEQPYPENKLREMRKLRGHKSPEKFATLIGISKTHLTRIEDRKRRFTTEIQHKCAKELHCTIQELTNIPVKNGPGIDPPTMRLAIAVIQNACQNQDVVLTPDAMSHLVTEVYDDIITINLDIHQAQRKAEQLVTKQVIGKTSVPVNAEQ